jgi:DNA repair exonuclease SbcCD ATPase subunit
MKSDFAVNDVIKKNCVVRVTFDNGYEVERFRKHKEKGNGLKIYKNSKYLSELERGNTRDSQKVLEGLLGISFEAFTKAVVLGDNASMNFLMSDSKRRRETIEELLEMDIFDLFLAEVRERKKSVQLSVTQDTIREESMRRDMQARDEELQRGLATRKSLLQQQKEMQESSEYITQQLDEWKAKEKSLKETEKNWTQLRNDQRVLDKWELYQSASQARQLAVNALEGIQEQLAESQTNQQQLLSMGKQENSIREVSRLLTELQGPRLTLLQSDIARKEQRIVEVKNQKEKMVELINGGNCPTCQQSVSGSKMHKPVQELEAQLSAATADLNNSIASKKALETETSSATASLSKLLSGITLQEYMDKIAKKTHVEEQVASLVAQVRQHTDNLAAMQDPSQVLKELKMPLEKVKSIVAAASTKVPSADHTAHDPAEALSAHQAQHASLAEEKFRIQSELTRLSAALKESEDKHNEVAEAKMTLETELGEMTAQRDTTSHQLKLLEYWEKGFDKRTLKSAEYPTMRSYMLSQSVEVYIPLKI